MNNRITLAFFVFFSFLGIQLNAQITVDDTPTAVDMVTNTLIGSGVSVSNITFSGQASQKGTFVGGSSNIGLTNGIVLSSGNVVDCVPPSQPSNGQFGGAGDNDVLATAQSVTSNPAAWLINSTADAAVLEFDFTPMGDTVRFTFVFASEEYLSWVNSQYNDAFGFYISGPNPAGGAYNVENLALVPNTTEPITISTIHPGLNSQYYIGTPTGHSFNGFTVPIDIVFPVVCGETYHFKFAVADCTDDFLDTGVFIEGGSFSSEAVDVTVASVTGDSAVYEGCTTADFVFTRPTYAASDSLIVNYDIEGTATDGVDFPSLPNPVVFPPGEDTVIITVDPYNDGLTEGQEYLTLTAYTISACGDTIESSGTLWILDEPIIEIDELDTTILCANDSVPVWAYASGGFPPFTYAWSNGDTGETAFAAGLVDGPTDYYITATDGCGYSQTDTVTITLNQTLAIDSMNMIPSNACDPTGVVLGFGSGFTGQPLYEWTGPDTIPGNYYIDGTVLQNIPTGWYYFSIEDDVCSVMDSIFVEPLDPPVAQINPSTIAGCDPLTVTFANGSQNTNNYYWDFGNGNDATVGNENSQTQTYSSSSTVMLIAYQSPGCADTTYVSIGITTCGCTDQLAVNYDPNAVSDDGSCFYPEPEVIAPNVFTPNGDTENPYFTVDTKNTVQLELIILNRWGNVLYSTDQDLTVAGAFVGWDGKTQRGVDAEEGTYFYKYTATGLDGTQVEGHGFLELIRD